MKKLDPAKLDQFKKEPEQPLQPEFEPDLIPEDPYKDSEPRVNLKDHVDILEAYEKYGSPLRDGFRPSFRPNQRENIMVRCPIPGHVDLNPDAWITLDKNTICCGPCGNEGLDLYDLAAIYYEYPYPDAYKRDKDQFKELCEKIADDFSITVTRTLAGPSITRAVEPSLEVPGLEGGSLERRVTGPNSGKAAGQPGNLVSPGSSQPEVEPTDLPPDPPSPGPVDRHLQVVPDTDDFDWGTVKVEYPEIDYSVIRTPGTFIDDCLGLFENLNYTLAHALFISLPAISLATRRHFMAADEPAVRSNLYVVLLGESGSTKTKAQSLFIRLIKQAFPFDDPEMGVNLFVPISGEHILTHMMVDPSAGSIDNPGCVVTNEYARLAKIMERPGSTMETYLQDFFDNEEPVSHKVGSAFNHHLCMVTTTQPDMVKDHLTLEHVQSGYANRLIFSYGPPGIPDDWNETVDLKDLVRKLQEIYAFYKYRGLRVTLEPDAKNYWSTFFHDQIVPDKRTSTRLITRVDLILKKLFLLFAANELSEVITLHHVEQATSLYGYLKSSAEYVQGKVGFGEHEDCHDDIRDYLQRKPRALAKRLEPTMRKRGHKYRITMATLRMMVDIGEVGVEKVGYALYYSLSDTMAVPKAKVRAPK